MTLKDRIKQHEGLRLKRYKDTVGVWTIYYGHRCLPGEKYRGTKKEAEQYLDKDIQVARETMQEIFPNFGNFTQERREVLIELLFNLGEPRFLGFKKMIHNINIGHWSDAANELKRSLWYRQVDSKPGDGAGRGDELVEMLRGDD